MNSVKMFSRVVLADFPAFESVVSISTFCAWSHRTAVHTNVLTTALEDCILSQPWRAMRFEWDEQKNRQNLHKHDVRFETAVLVFDDPTRLRSVTSLSRMRHVG